MRSYQPHTQQQGLQPYLHRPVAANFSKRVYTCSNSKRRRLLDSFPRLGVCPGFKQTAAPVAVAVKINSAVETAGNIGAADRSTCGRRRWERVGSRVVR